MGLGNNGLLHGARQLGQKFRDVAITGGGPGVPKGFRLVGANLTGPPTGGTWKVGDIAVGLNGGLWMCVIAGTPGIWVPCGLPMQASNAQSGGYTVINGTGNLFSWQPPADGLVHHVIIVANILVGATTTGGVMQAQFDDPTGSSRTQQLFGTALAAGLHTTTNSYMVTPGIPVTIQQSTALTAGGPCTFWATIFGI